MRLIRVTPLHAEALAEVHAAAMPEGETWNAAAIASLLVLPGTFGLADAECGMVLARVAADEAEILTLAVPPNRRRQGRGSMLLAAAEAGAAGAGATAMYLEVAERNEPALALYQRSGYVVAGSRKAYYRDGGMALIMKKPL